MEQAIAAAKAAGETECFIIGGAAVYREAMPLVDKLYYTEFMKRLSEITDYYNFSGLNEITRDQNNYFDPSHFGAEIGDIVLSCLNGQEVPEELYEDGFGWYVTEENIDELLNVLEAGKVDKPE